MGILKKVNVFVVFLNIITPFIKIYYIVIQYLSCIYNTIIDLDFHCDIISKYIQGDI